MSITLNTVVYTFQGIVDGIATYRSPGATPAEVSTLTCRIDNVSGNGNAKARWKLKVPTKVTAIDDPAYPGIKEVITDIVVTMAPSSTVAERTDAQLRTKDLTTHAAYAAAMTGFVLPTV